MSERVLNAYDRRELAVMRGALRSAVENLEWMGEDGRGTADREIRASIVAGITAKVNRMARNFERRWA